MTQQDAAAQAPVNVETDNDGVLMNVCRLRQSYYAKVRLQMRTVRERREITTTATILPYVIVHATSEAPNIWTVITPPNTNTGNGPDAGIVQIEVSDTGRYRIYIKEPTETPAQGSVFTIQQHALANGNDSGREVQPLLELDVTDNADCTMSVQRTHPNGLGRGQGNGDDQVPANGARQNFTQTHTSRALARSLDLGDYVISHQLWADASRTYGINHPRVQNSQFQAALQMIYGETLTPGTGAGSDAQDRTLTSEGIEIEFDHQSTTGGRTRLSFLENNGQPSNRMTADESLRRTHPATIEFLIQMMADLNITYARSSGAWRPHVGSTRHRYASAIDLTHLRTNVLGANNQQHRVAIHLHRINSPNSNPQRTHPQETAERTRMREFSHLVHVYIAQAKQEGTLGWLGGPWPLTYARLGLPGPQTPNGRTPNAPAIATDDTHIHHIHISMGTDQP